MRPGLRRPSTPPQRRSPPSRRGTGTGGGIKVAATQAASMALCMVLVGSGAGNVQASAADYTDLGEVVAKLRNYSRETHHEKIIQGISLCLALVNYGQEEHADTTLEEMRGDRDPIIRYGAMYGLALAYCGTGSNKSIRILLHTAVNNVGGGGGVAGCAGGRGAWGA